MADPTLTNLLSQLTARRRLFGGALGALAGILGLAPSSDASRQGKRRKKQKKRWARQTEKWNRREGQRLVQECKAESTPDQRCYDEHQLCCDFLWPNSRQGWDIYCLCMSTQYCGECVWS